MSWVSGYSPSPDGAGYCCVAPCFTARSGVECWQPFNAVVDMETAQVESLLQRAIALHQQQHLEAARRLYREVLELDAQQLSALNNLGALLMDAGGEGAEKDLDEAELLFQRALAIEPHYTNAYNNLGMVFERKSLWEEAEACYLQALELDPNHARARNNLGNVLKARGDLPGATKAYLDAHHLAPGEVSILANLGNCLLELGQFGDAEKCYRAALQLEPRRAELHNGLGRVLQAADHLESALASYREALRLDPELRAAHNNVGVVQLEHNDTAAAIHSFEQVLARDPLDIEARLNHALALPILYSSMDEVAIYRERYTQQLQQVCGDFLAQRKPPRAQVEKLMESLSRRTTFYLQYQGEVDLALQKQYGQLLEYATRHTIRPFVHRAPSGRQKLRVGYISSLFRDHTVGKLMKGFVEQADRSQFELYTYYLGYEEQALTKRYQLASDVFRHLPARLQSLVGTLRADQLDVLIFGEIAMTPVLASVAAARVAPLQGLFWGHPVTSGLSTMDFAITSAGMEPPEGAFHYSETLVPLSGIGLSYDRPLVPAPGRSRASFGLRDDDVVYLSCQSLYKYLPCSDVQFPQIALQVPQARFVFLAHPRAPHVTRLFRQRLERAFLEFGLDAERYCRFLPHLSQADYFALNQRADVFLDTPGWSGGNTTLEALAVELPVVTLPGGVMRSRHAYAMLKALGLEECIAENDEQYVGVAVQLGRSGELRREIRQLIRERADTQLFHQQGCVKELETWLLERTGRGGGV